MGTNCWTSWPKYLVPIIFLTLSIALGDEVKLSKHPVLLIVSYDGFRYDYLDKTATPNLHFIKSKGVSVPYMQNQFVTFTFPNHHSIATGLYLESHGVVANSLYDPLYGKWLSGGRNDPGFWNYSTSVVPLYILNELGGDERASGVMMWAGSTEAYGEENTKATYIKPYDSSYLFESRVDDAFDWITKPDKPANLVFLYFPEPDGFGHTCGPESFEVIQQIQRMDNITGYIWNKLETLGLTDKVNVIFTSDHGMTEVRQDEPGKFIDLSQIVDNTDDGVYVNYGSTPIMQLLPNREEDTEQIYNTFKAASANLNFSAYLKEETIASHPEWHYSNSRRIMPILLVADPGYTFEYETKTGKGPPKIGNAEPPSCAVPTAVGHHGFDNASPEMHPYFMAIGPLFKEGGVVEEPFQNIDIYPLVSKIMGLPDHPVNGSLSRICPILRDTTACN